MVNAEFEKKTSNNLSLPNYKILWFVSRFILMMDDCTDDIVEGMHLCGSLNL